MSRSDSDRIHVLDTCGVRSAVPFFAEQGSGAVHASGGAVHFGLAGFHPGGAITSRGGQSARAPLHTKTISIRTFREEPT